MPKVKITNANEFRDGGMTAKIDPNNQQTTGTSYELWILNTDNGER